MVLIDLNVALGSSFRSFDQARRAIVDGGILVGGRSINASSEQNFFAS